MALSNPFGRKSKAHNSRKDHKYDPQQSPSKVIATIGRPQNHSNGNDKQPAQKGRHLATNQEERLRYRSFGILQRLILVLFPFQVPVSRVTGEVIQMTVTTFIGTSIGSHMLTLLSV